MKGLPWTPLGNPFCCFLARLSQVEDRNWVENVYSKWRNTTLCTTRLRRMRLLMEFTNIKWVKQMWIQMLIWEYKFGSIKHNIKVYNFIMGKWSPYMYIVTLAVDCMTSWTICCIWLWKKCLIGVDNWR